MWREPNPVTMLPELGELSRLRRSVGLTQARLAALAGVSQSAIAKIERGQMIPSYDLARRLFETLQRQLEKVEPEVVASKVRTRTVHSVGPEATLQEAAEVMRRRGFSQLPVVKDGRNLGNLAEGTIARLILEGKSLKDLAQIRVSQVMDAPLPAIDENAPVSIIAALLQRYPAVLVVRGGEITGIIAKSDLMKLL
jgi:predicted transcriptional regulator